MVKLKFILKAFLCAVIFTSGALAKFDNKIYLLPKDHNEKTHQSLLNNIGKKAKAHKVILGLAVVQHDSGIDYNGQCLATGFCDLNETDKTYFVNMENSLASAIAHFIYFYRGLILIEGFEQIQHHEKDTPIHYYAQAQIPVIWQNRIGLQALVAALGTILSTRVAYEAWNSVEKGPMMQKIADDLKLMRVSLPQQPLKAIQDWLGLMSSKDQFSYTKERVKGFIQELPILIEGLIGKLLEQEVAVGIPYDFEQELLDIRATLAEVRPVRVTYPEDMERVFPHSDMICNGIGNRLRGFFMAQTLMNVYETAKKLDVPLVAFIGYEHTAGLYEFLKLKGFDLEVGMRKNVLNLDDASFQIAQSCDMKYVAQREYIMSFLRRFKDTDLQILEAYEFVIGDEQELSEHDEL